MGRGDRLIPDNQADSSDTYSLNTNLSAVEPVKVIRRIDGFCLHLVA